MNIPKHIRKVVLRRRWFKEGDYLDYSSYKIKDEQPIKFIFSDWVEMFQGETFMEIKNLVRCYITVKEISSSIN